MEQKVEDLNLRFQAMESIARDLMKERNELWELNKKLRQYWAEDRAKSLI